MGERNLHAALLVLALAGASTAQAESTLQGLEMDVMEPGESAAQATGRIALPRPRNGIERSAEYPGLDTESGIGGPGAVRPDAVRGEGLFTGEPSLDPVSPTDGPSPEPAVPDPAEPPAVPGSGYTAPIDSTGGSGG